MKGVFCLIPNPQKFVEVGYLPNIIRIICLKKKGKDQSQRKQRPKVEGEKEEKQDQQC